MGCVHVFIYIYIYIYIYIPTLGCRAITGASVHYYMVVNGSVLIDIHCITHSAPLVTLEEVMPIARALPLLRGNHSGCSPQRLHHPYRLSPPSV